MNSRAPTALEHHPLTTSDGWTLDLRRGRRASGPVDGAPVLIVHGFGMNGRLFHSHPSGPSFFDVLLDHGLDPWVVDLRGTRSSRPPRGGKVQLADLAFRDVPEAIDAIRRLTGRDKVHAIGVSLGGGLLYAHLGRDAHHVDRLVTMGSPFIWQDHGPVLHGFAALGPLLAHIPVRGTALGAQAILPVARRLGPGAIGFYVNPEITDTRRADILLRTVEDPQPGVSAALSRWIRERHLFVDGHDVTLGARNIDRPLLVVYAAGDGVCPPATARAVIGRTKGSVDVLEIAHPPHRVSHVDLFAAWFTPEKVFGPVARWLASEPRR